MRKLFAAAVLLALLACLLWPSTSFTEDRDTVRLAQTIHALAGRDSYEAKLAVGSLVMNRVEDGWFANSLGEVLSDQMQFPAGKRYDADSLRAAHEVLTGTRTLDQDALYYRRSDAGEKWGDDYLVDCVGELSFYTRSGNI